MTLEELKKELKKVTDELDEILKSLDDPDDEDDQDDEGDDSASRASNLDEIEKRSNKLIEKKESLEAQIKEAEKRERVKGMIDGTKKSSPIEVHKAGEGKMERTFGVNTVEYRDAFMKSLMGKPLDEEERAALTKARSVIPTDTLNKVFEKMKEYPLYAELEVLNIPGYVDVPVETTTNDASWLPMSTASTDSEDAVDSVHLGVKKLIKTIEITADIKAMAIPAFEVWLTKKLAQKMVSAICAAVIAGDGTTAAQGIMGKITPTPVTAEKFNLEALSTLMGKIPSAYHGNAIWVMSSANFYSKVVPLCKDSNGVLVQNGIENRLLGHKVAFEDTAGDHFIYGDFKDGYLFNMGEDITIASDSSVAFRSGSTVYRAMALCDGNVTQAEAFGAIKLGE